MTDHTFPVGRVLRSSTTSLTLGTKTLAADVPRFGGFVKVAAPDGGDVIGLIYDVVIEDDLFARQLIGAEVSAEYIADQRQNRQVPIEISRICVAAEGIRVGWVSRLAVRRPIIWVIPHVSGRKRSPLRMGRLHRGEVNFGGLPFVAEFVE